jgi:hypothetical protein
MKINKHWEGLPVFAGQVLKRLGLLNRLEMDDAAFTRRIEDEQKRRTYERKQAQIERAMKDKKK